MWWLLIVWEGPLRGERLSIHVDEQPPDDLAFRLRLIHALERRIEPRCSARNGEIEPDVLPEHLLHLLRLPVASQPVIDVDAVETLPDGLVQQHRNHGGIDAARKPQHHLVFADPRPQLLDRVRHPVAEVPAFRAAAHAEDEVREDLRAVLRMDDLRMELERVEALRVVVHRRERTGRRHHRAAFEAGGDRLHTVAVAHPYNDRRGHALEKRVSGHDLDRHLAVFPRLARHHTTAQLLAHELHPVADAQHRHTQLEDRRINRRRAVLEHAVRPARENHPHRWILAQRRRRGLTADALRIDLHLPDASRNELRVLGAIVEDRDPLTTRFRNLPRHLHSSKLKTRNW